MAPRHPHLRASLAPTLLAVAAVGGLGGCQSYKAPDLSVASVTPGERTPDGASMVFTLDARNDNDVALPLRTVEYRLSLDGREVFNGTRSAEATLRRLGVQQVRLPVAVAAAGGAGPASGPSKYQLTGRMYYVTPGQLAEVLFDAGVRTPNVPFSFEGTVDLSQAPVTAAE
jgi:hypothetical protein